MELRILELFSGIGGMHYAFKKSNLNGSIVAAMDINTVANAVYKHNHPQSQVLNNNIQSLQPRTLEKMHINMITMSPPCQPHTRIGHQKDIADARSDAFQHICKILPECPAVEYVLVENVKGFEKSQARDAFIEAITSGGFHYREFILSPTQFSVANTRHRYYCVARRTKDFAFAGQTVLEHWPTDELHEKDSKVTLKEYLEDEASIGEDYYLTDKVLGKRVWLMDIVTPEATNTMCFTKAYTHYSEGTGSIFSNLSKAELEEIFKQVKESSTDEERLSLLRTAKLRYFTPRECLRLMSFPEDFRFPAETTNRQKYRLIGNSVNVHVVGELIKLLCT